MCLYLANNILFKLNYILIGDSYLGCAADKSGNQSL